MVTVAAVKTGAAQNDGWIKDVNDLADDVQAWAGEQGWSVVRGDTQLSEAVAGGAYQVPRLTVDAPEGRLLLEPVARGVVGAAGRVDLYAWPSHYRVMLLRQAGGGWVVRTESGLDWPQPWGRETFLTVARGLLNAA